MGRGYSGQCPCECSCWYCQRQRHIVLSFRCRVLLHIQHRRNRHFVWNGDTKATHSGNEQLRGLCQLGVQQLLRPGCDRCGHRWQLHPFRSKCPLFNSCNDFHHQPHGQFHHRPNRLHHHRHSHTKSFRQGHRERDCDWNGFLLRFEQWRFYEWHCCIRQVGDSKQLVFHCFE